jgi:hypothetical protein
VEKYIVEPDRSQMTIWRMRVACWISQSTNTHSEYVIRIAFPPQQWLRERASQCYVIRILRGPVGNHYTWLTELKSTHCVEKYVDLSVGLQSDVSD